MASLNTLGQIRTKVRRLTRSVSEAQITTAQIDEYINTFVLYDLPGHIKLDFLATTLTFYTLPNIDTYGTTAIVGDPMVDFKNRYLNVGTPVYIAGNLAFYTQSRDEFYRAYPQICPTIDQQISNLTPNYAGILTNHPVLRNSVVFSMVDAAGVGYEVHDDGAGNLVGDTGGASTINYLTGAYVIVFAAVPAAGTYVKSSSYAYTASRPDSVLFYDTHFTLRPVPDGVYQVTLNARIRPTEFLNNAAQQPDLDEWAQYIAFGTAKKIYEDRFDMESVQALMPSFKEQEQLCLRRTIMQQRDQRAASQYNTMEKGHYWWNIWL